MDLKLSASDWFIDADISKNRLGKMNSIRAYADEIVVSEVIYS